MPSWAAVLIAISATLAGFAIEAGSGHQELGFIFGTCYALGCIAAVVFVRRNGIFTAVIQPPLLLFVAVPLAYYLFHGSAFNGLKDVLISCGYPLIERFPLMLFTSAAVLLIGLSRWYVAMGQPAAGTQTAAGPSRFAALAGRFAAMSKGMKETSAARPRRESRPDTSRARRRPPREDDAYGRPQRQRRQSTRAATYAEPRERSRPVRDSGRRTPPPQRRDPRERPRPNRGDRFDPYPPPGRGYESYRDPYGPPEPRRRPAGGEPTHHPVSRVRYRSDGDYPEDRR